MSKRSGEKDFASKRLCETEPSLLSCNSPSAAGFEQELLMSKRSGEKVVNWYRIECKHGNARRFVV